MQNETSLSLMRKRSDSCESESMNHSKQCNTLSNDLEDSLLSCFDALISRKAAKNQSTNPFHMVVSKELNKLWGSIDSIKQISESSRKLIRLKLRE